jgi:hypothetical protein
MQPKVAIIIQSLPPHVLITKIIIQSQQTFKFKVVAGDKLAYLFENTIMAIVVSSPLIYQFFVERTNIC